MSWARSVRGRTTILATLLVALTLGVASVLLVLTLQRSLTESRDQVSRDLAERLVDDLAAGTLHSPIAVGEDAMAQVVGPDGSVLAASTSLGRSGPVTDATAPVGGFRLLVLEGLPDDEDTETYRVWATTAPSADGPARVFVGGSPERVTEAVRALRNGLLVGVPVVVVALAGAISFLVGRALRPVEQIRADVAEISAGGLDRRVPEPATGDEVARLARTMNAMLERLDEGDRRQREFVADASHELLSPLASFRAQLEVAAATPDTTPWASVSADLLADSDRMERLVRDLLFLAREDAGPPEVATWRAGPGPAGPGPIRGALIDLDDVVLDEVTRLRASAETIIDVTAVSAAPVRGRGEDLSRLVRNLLENAVDHAATRVVVTLEQAGQEVRLTVSDDGSGVPPEVGERIFERFVRAVPDRGRKGGGTGLGLSIARSIARRHGGDVVWDAPAPGAAFVVTLPGA